MKKKKMTRSLVSTLKKIMRHLMTGAPAPPAIRKTKNGVKFVGPLCQGKNVPDIFKENLNVIPFLVKFQWKIITT